MIIYLPCKIGEEFTRLKFKDWVNGKRIYEEGGNRTLRGFNAFDCTTRSLAIPTIHADKEFISYDHLGEFAQEFTPQYKISVDLKSEYKLSDRGFPSGKTGHLSGIITEGGYLLADFVTKDRYEHLRYVIKDNLQYAGLDETPTESLIEFDPEAQAEKEQREQESRENTKVLKEIRAKAAEPKKKGVSLKDLIKAKAKKTEVADDSSN